MKPGEPIESVLPKPDPESDVLCVPFCGRRWESVKADPRPALGKFIPAIPLLPACGSEGGGEGRGGQLTHFPRNEKHPHLNVPFPLLESSLSAYIEGQQESETQSSFPEDGGDAR